MTPTNGLPNRFKRVWFIGAGFSIAMGYPLGRGLVSDIVEYLSGSKKRLFRRLPPRFKSNYKSSVARPQHQAKCAALLKLVEEFSQRYLARTLAQLTDVDVAEFYSIAQTMADEGLFEEALTSRGTPSRSRETRPSDFGKLYHDLSAATRSYFIDICSSVTSLPKDLKSVLNGISRHDDAIVSFNWDEEVDVFLTTQRDTKTQSFDLAYTGHSWEPNRFLILKPHGSVGWYDVAQGISNKDPYFVADHQDERIERSNKRLIAYDEVDLPKEIDTGEERPPLTCSPVITPPTFGKRFPYVEQRLIWRDVIDVCRRADEFVFLGYSLPQDDFLTRAAIRCALQDSERRRKRLRCLVVTKFGDERPAPPEVLLKNFGSVFGQQLDAKNFLDWTFGKSSPALFPAIQAHLPKARV